MSKPVAPKRTSKKSAKSGSDQEEKGSKEEDSPLS